MLTAPHPENLVIGNRYRFSLDYDGRIEWEEGILEGLYGRTDSGQMKVTLFLASGVWSEFEWRRVLGVEPCGPKKTQP